jgi:antirestriction protein ArdC
MVENARSIVPILRKQSTCPVSISSRTAWTITVRFETTHWTSHNSRCGWELGKRFGDAAYAMEELVGELGSAYTMAGLELELTPRRDHAAYIDS